MLCQSRAVALEAGDEVRVLGDTARSQRLDPQRFGRIARCQLPTRFIVEARLGRLEGIAAVVLAL